MVIEEQKENAAHIHNSKRENKNQYNLAIEELFTKELDITIENLLSQSMYMPETSNSITLSLSDLYTPTKFRNTSTFEHVVIINFLRNCGSRRRPPIDGLSVFKAIFWGKKSPEVDSLDKSGYSANFSKLRY